MVLYLYFSWCHFFTKRIVLLVRLRFKSWKFLKSVSAPLSLPISVNSGSYFHLFVEDVVQEWHLYDHSFHFHHTAYNTLRCLKINSEYSLHTSPIQWSKGLRQWPIIRCTSQIMTHKIIPSLDKNSWLKGLDTQLNEPRN